MPKCESCEKEFKIKDLKMVEPRKYVCSDECKHDYEEGAKTKFMVSRLNDYINDVWDKPNFKVVTAQIDKLKKNFGFKIEGMYLTLKWCFEIEDKSSEIIYGVHYLISNYYESAREYYQECLNRAEIVSESIEEEVVVVCRSNDKERKVAQYRANVRGLLE